VDRKASSTKHSLLLDCISVAIGLVVCLNCFGCRVIRDKRQARELNAARQISRRGADALQQNKFSDAESLFGEALKHSAADERAQWGYAEVLWQRGQTKQATEHMMRAVETSGGNPDFIVRLGQMHLAQNDLPRAVEKAQEALRQNRSQADAWALLGDAYRQQKNLQESLDCYSRSLIFQKNAPTVQVSLAEIYRQLGRPQRALATLTSLEYDYPEDKVPPRAWLLKGLAYSDLGETENAKKYMQLAARHAGDSTELMMELAQAQYQTGDLVEARLCLGRVLAKDSQNATALALQTEIDQSFAQLSNPASLAVQNVTFQRQEK
jgi:Tfp pilus assembly protein PilF